LCRYAVPSYDLLITVFLSIILLASILSIRLKLPYTVILVLVGIGLAFTTDQLLSAGGSIGQAIAQIRSLSQGSVGSGLFVGLVVPPLIFQALMHVRSSDLKSVIRPSFTLATVGVVIATLVGGIVLWKIVGLPFSVSFLFASLISPTDAATVLEMFRRVKVPSKLVALMDTEAAFNDATGIVVFTIVLTSINVNNLPLYSALFDFLVLFGGGVVTGLGVAFGAELLTSVVRDPLTETILTVSVVYGSYTLASSLGFSGLVAVSVVGLYFGNFTARAAMGSATRETIRVFWEIAAFVSNSVAFLFIGFRTDLLKLYQSWELVLLALVAVLIARASTVYPILTLFDRVRDNIPLKWRNVAMLGGFRGALSIALAASLAGSTVLTSSDQETIATMVLGVAFISITVQAGVLSRYIRGRFKEDQTGHEEERLELRVAKAVSAIETLQKMKDEGKMSEEDFLLQLENERDEITEAILQASSAISTKGIFKSRAERLFSLINTSSWRRATKTLQDNLEGKPIEKLVEELETGQNKENDAEKNEDGSANSAKS